MQELEDRVVMLGCVPKAEKNDLGLTTLLQCQSGHYGLSDLQPSTQQHFNAHARFL